LHQSPICDRNWQGAFIYETDSGSYPVWMARLPRIVIPGIGHHVTPRGNRREQTFFEDGD